MFTTILSSLSCSHLCLKKDLISTILSSLSEEKNTGLKLAHLLETVLFNPKVIRKFMEILSNYQRET